MSFNVIWMNKKNKYANILEQVSQQKAFLPTYAPNLEEQMVQQNATLWMKFGGAKMNSFHNTSNINANNAYGWLVWYLSTV